jgi:tRNA threonylcarbamoyladenosine biosynthesis protein TsaE
LHRRLAACPALADAVIALHGDLGAGKTTLVRHLLRALGVERPHQEPDLCGGRTAQQQRLPAGCRGRAAAIWHFDFYRFNDPREWEDAGFRELFAAPGLKLVEWPERAAGVMPVADLEIDIRAEHPPMTDPTPIDEHRRVKVQPAPRAGSSCWRRWLDAPAVRTRSPQPAARRFAGAVAGRAADRTWRQVVAVRLWPANDYTRVTIESDGALKARHFMISDPPRLVVDIEGIDLLPSLRELVGKLSPDDPNIAGIRAAQNAPAVVRLVIDLKQPIARRCSISIRWRPTSTGW